MDGFLGTCSSNVRTRFLDHRPSTDDAFDCPLGNSKSFRDSPVFHPLLLHEIDDVHLL